MGEPERRHAEIDGLKIHWTEAGEGRPLLLLHGWPTSSFLWRNIIPHLSRHRRIIAPDLPGFGDSDKPLDRAYDFEMHRRVLDGLFDHLHLDGPLGMVVHDIGGPIGFYWARHASIRLDRVALLNTLVYPDLHWMERAFIAACGVPGLRRLISSSLGLRCVLRMGLAKPSRLSRDDRDTLLRPFRDEHSRRSLLRSIACLDAEAMQHTIGWLRGLEIPMRMIYGAADRILHGLPRTVRRLEQDLPQLEITALRDCGHFLQEEQPAEVGRALAEFFDGAPQTDARIGEGARSELR
ncbi:MAG: alpha/beta fold hydrolase [Deltaproteobacteria bacterium]|nr:alpha/beta fold hydrolase [Nannocystaceae bacterium]